MLLDWVSAGSENGTGVLRFCRLVGCDSKIWHSSLVEYSLSGVMLIRLLDLSLGAAARFWFVLRHCRLGRLDSSFSPAGALQALFLEVQLVVRLLGTTKEGLARLELLVVTDEVVPLILIHWPMVDVAPWLTERVAAAVFEALHSSVSSTAVEAAAAEVVRFAADFVLIFALEAVKKECTAVPKLEAWETLHLLGTEAAIEGFGFWLVAAVLAC
jgi:hypothetical protein